MNRKDEKAMICSVKEYDRITEIILKKIISKQEDWHIPSDGIAEEDYMDVVGYVWNSNFVKNENPHYITLNRDGGEITVYCNEIPIVTSCGEQFVNEINVSKVNNKAFVVANEFKKRLYNVLVKLIDGADWQEKPTDMSNIDFSNVLDYAVKHKYILGVYGGISRADTYNISILGRIRISRDGLIFMERYEGIV